ncbi:MAG: peptidylprolyl isomerase [Sphingomicrobium sp.]
MRTLIVLGAMVLTAAAPPPAKKALTPADIVAKSPLGAWTAIPDDDVMVIDFKGGGRTVVQLAPRFAPVHVANVKALARGGYWDGASVYRLQDNYVAQWGLNESDRPWPAGVVAKPPAEYTRPLKALRIKPLGYPDAYAPAAGFADGWQIAYSPKAGWANLAHCYGSVGVGRDLSPDTGTGGELYAVIGQGPRALDRNIALIGRVIEGIDRFSSLPRGPAPMGFYADRKQDFPIQSIRLASDMPLAERPLFEVMDTNSATFARLLHLKANRKDDFFVRPAGGIDLCSATVPVRKRT